jgi:hypothetical protein
MSIIHNTAADIIIKGFDSRTKKLPKTKKLYSFIQKIFSLYQKFFQNLGEPEDQECHPVLYFL